MSRILNPQNNIDNDLNKIPEYVSQRLTMINYVRDLGRLGKPKTAAELQTRLDDYFKLCKDNAIKPTIEGMALACGVDRRRFWEWCAGKNGPEYQEICICARQVLTTFLETALYENKINAVAGIFALKNIAGWTDTKQIENITHLEKETAATLPIFNAIEITDKSET